MCDARRMVHKTTTPVHRTARRTVRLPEEVVRTGSGLIVDRDKGVIRNVKVLGSQSENGRCYLPEAVEKAVHLYEGRSVRINHPRRPEDSRDSEDVFGWLENVRVVGGELFADLHYLQSHPMAERICEAAERNPKLFGLSHNAEGQGETVRGVFEVQEITEVRSVDVVADPATTRGLAESRSRSRSKRMNFRKFLEAWAGVKALGPRRRKALRRLLEAGMGDDYMDTEMPDEAAPPEDAAPADHHQALADGFRAASVAVLDDDSMSADEKIKRLKELLKTHEKLSAPVEEDEPAGERGLPEPDLEVPADQAKGFGGKGKKEIEEFDEEWDEDEDDMKEELRRYKARDRARCLCEEAGVVCSSAMLEALAALSSDRKRRALLEDLRAHRSGGRPRTQAVAESASSRRVEEITDGKGLAIALKQGAFTGEGEGRVSL